jgi:uncharacterized membrane protein
MKSRWEIVHMSMFFSPMVAIFGAIVLGIVMTYVDFYLTEQGVEPPTYLTTNVSSARSILSTIAGATISFAGTAFSVSLLVIQLASSQYSPRIVHTLFKDPFNRRIMALVMGTFTYCLVVMRSVGESSMGDDEEASVVPHISVGTAFILGVFSLLAIVAFIDHSAGAMDVSNLLESVTRDTMIHIKETWREETLEEVIEEDENKHDLQVGAHRDDDRNIEVKLKRKPHSVTGMEDTTVYDFIKEEQEQGGTPRPAEGTPMEEKSKTTKYNDGKDGGAKGEDAKMEKKDDCYVVRSRTSGWVQELDMEYLLQLVPPNGYIKLHTLAGRYAFPGTAVCSVYPKPQDVEMNLKSHAIRVEASQDMFVSDDNIDEDDETYLLEEFDLNVLDAIMIGCTRTIRSDPSYGLRQLVDVVLRALSPGVNDPTTAQDGIFHIAAVVTEFLRRVPPDKIMETDDGGKLYCMEQQDYDRIVRLAFEEVRVCAAGSPMVALYLLEALRLIRESLQAFGRPRRGPEIERQARLVEEGIRNASHIKEDYEFIVKARQDRFDTDITTESINRFVWAERGRKNGKSVPSDSA